MSHRVILDIRLEKNPLSCKRANLLQEAKHSQEVHKLKIGFA